MWKSIGKIFAILFICFVTYSCGYDTQENSQKSESNDLEYKVSKVEFEGHTYLVWSRRQRWTICHDENCGCK
ncbi:MAG: hypothetical protein J1F35_08265 [Erysipelotrichales bacterium]|nr:hypothetical protein [Erysipelotrichales bacterium]